MMGINDFDSHPLDFRGMDRDPALVDLQPHKDAAHADRIQREAQQAERRRDYLRNKYAGQGEITRTIKTPKKQDVVMITGNRKLQDPASIRAQISDLIDDNRPDIAISGMAIGTDQLFAEICIKRGIPIHAYIPFSGQENRWSAQAQKRYREMLTHCEKKIVVCDTFSMSSYQSRNVAMVEASTRAIAVWNRHPGGTKNCIKVLDRTKTPYTIVENRTGA